MTNADVIKVGFASWMFGQVGLNIRYYRATAVLTGGPTMQEVADQLKTAFGGLFANLLTDDAEFLGVAARNISPTPLEACWVSSGAPLAGLEATPALPSQTCGLIKLITNLAGRSKRGRIFIPFPGTGVNAGADDRPTPGYMTDLDAMGLQLIATQVIVGAAGSVDMVPLIFSPTNGLLQQVVTGFVSRRAWATQRRRGSLGATNPEQIPLV